MPETKKHLYVRTLREIADYVESHAFDEDLPFFVPSVYLFCKDAAQFGRAVAAAGDTKKSAVNEFLDATVMFGFTKFHIAIAQKEICYRVKIGQKVIPAKPEHLLPAEPERVEDVFEWDCPKSYIALRDADA